MKKIMAGLAAALALIPVCATAQIALTAPTDTVRWGSNFALQASLQSCSPAPGPVSLVDVTMNMAIVGGSVGAPSACPANVAVIPDWRVTAPAWQYLQATAGGLTSPQKPIRFDQEFDLAYRGDRIQGTLATDSRWLSCTARSLGIRDRESIGIPMPPPNIRTDYEMFEYAAGSCVPGSQFGNGFAGVLQLPETVGDLWLYTKALGWRRVPRGVQCPLAPMPCTAVVPGPVEATYFRNSVMFGVNQNDASSIYAVAAVAYPQPDLRGADLQDLWWSGPSEAGWGLTIAKNGEKLFVAGFIYDIFGKPMWIVMPSGQWDPDNLVWYGDLYIPKSAAYYRYESGVGLDMRAPVGKGSLSFIGPDVGRFDYTLGDYAGGKSLFRYVFAQRAKDPPPYAGIWWGGANQDGWGLSIAQQGETIFATWYTYGDDGEPVWFYMPAGAKTGTGKYSGKLYKTTGSQWPGAHYDGASTKVIEIGTLDLAFGADAKTGTMTAKLEGHTVVNPIQKFDF